MKQFQSGELLVISIVTAAAGVGVTLSKADSVHILDETWNPDDQEQVADRALDMSDIKQVSIFVYRSKNTIEQYIQDTTEEKMITNREILDLRRQGLRAIAS